MEQNGGNVIIAGPTFLTLPRSLASQKHAHLRYADIKETTVQQSDGVKTFVVDGPSRRVEFVEGHFAKPQRFRDFCELVEARRPSKTDD